MNAKRIVMAALAAAALAAPAAAGVLAGVEGTDGAGRTVEEVTAGKPAVVLLTSPRVADVGPQLRLLRFLAAELEGEAAVTAVVYGEKPENLAKLREGMSFPVFAGRGAVPPDVLGEGGKLPMTLCLSRHGNVVERRRDVPDALAAAADLSIRYDAGPPGPPPEGELLPELILPASDGKVYNLRANSLRKRKTYVYVFDVDDEKRRDILSALQYLADDLGTSEFEILPVMLGGSTAAATKLAQASYMDIPVLAGGDLARHRLIGKLEPPVLIVVEEKGLVLGSKSGAAVPTGNEVAAEESGPAEEGPPVELVVKRVGRLTEGLISTEAPVADFDATGRYVVFHGRFKREGIDHLYEVTAAGKGLRQISRAPVPDAAPACSPDGVHISFVSGRSGGNEIWTCERVHGEFTQITKSRGSYGPPRYDFNGDRLVASRKAAAGGTENFDVWVMTPRGRQERPVAETFYNEIDPAFSGDGSRILFASDRYDNWDIFYSDDKGGKRRRLTGPEADDRMPASSPDSRYVVYASKAPEGTYKLWVMNADGSSKMQLTAGPGNDLHPRFSRDGRSLVFVSDRSGSFEVYKIKFEAEPDYDLPRPGRSLATPGVS
jgi:TolB protein